jgi:hypothetical protein
MAWQLLVVVVLQKSMKKFLFSVALTVAFAGPASALTTTILANASATDPTSGIVVQSNTFQTAGTGVIDPFLRLQKNDSETGFNTSLNPPPGDAKASFTFDLQLSSLQIVTVGANSLPIVPSYQISLDINQVQSASNPLILLTTFDIYTGNTASRATIGDSFITGLTNDYLLTDLNSGSGAGDVQFYIPVTAFAGHTGDKFFTLNATFSNTNDGIEEFAAVIGPNAPHAAPDGGMTLVLLGSSLGAIELLRRTLAKRASTF